MDKYVNRILKFGVTAVAAALFSVSVYAGQPGATVDYATEKVTGVDSTMEYSLDNKNWVPIYGTTLNLSSFVSATKDQKIYVRVNDDTTAGNTKELSIPKRPVAPTGLALAIDLTAAGKDNDKITGASGKQIKFDEQAWYTAGGADVMIGKHELSGGTFSYRTPAVAGASGSFASVAGKIAIQKQAAAPKLVYDEKTDSIKLPANAEYRVGTKKGSTAVAWITPATGVTSVTRAMIEAATSGDKEGTNLYLYVRVKANATKVASETGKVIVPDKVAVAPTLTLTMETEKLKGTTTDMEYRVLTAAQKDAATYSYSFPAWTSAPDEELDLSKTFSASTVEAAAVKEYIEVRTKPVKATSDDLAKPGSTAVIYKIAKRPATPVETDVEVDFSIYNTEKFSVKKAGYEYRIGDAEATWKPIAEASSKFEVAVNDKFPTEGKLPFALRVKTDINITGSGDSAVKTFIPASAILNPTGATAGLNLNVRPEKPTPAWDETTQKVSGVSAKISYWIKLPNTGAGGTTAPTVAEINVAASKAAKFAGTSEVFAKTKKFGTTETYSMRVVEVNTVGAARFPQSDTAELACKYPAQVTELNDIKFSTAPVETVKKSETSANTIIAVVDATQTIKTGNQDLNPNFTYTIAAVDTSPVAGDLAKFSLVDKTLKLAGSTPIGTYKVKLTMTYKDDTVKIDGKHVDPAVIVKKDKEITVNVVADPITTVGVTLTAPTRGGVIASTAAATISTATPNFKVTTTAWTGGTTDWAANDIPKAEITLTADDDYVFTDATTVTSSLGEVGTKTVGAGAQKNTLKFTVTLPAVPKAPIATKAIAGVTAPAEAGTAVVEADVADGYTAKPTVSWSPALVSGKFASGTVYTATITITPGAAFTVTGVAKDFFTVAGATATNAADSGVVTAVFPATKTNITAFDAIVDKVGGTAGAATYADAAAVLAALPTVKANAGAITVPVTAWVSSPTYDAATAGTYTFTATLGTLPEGITNTGTKTATVKVVIAPAA